MRIVHVHHPYIPDRGYQENCLPHAQKAAGHDVTIVTGTVLPDSRSEGMPSFKPGEYEYDGIRTIRLPVVFEVGLTEDAFLKGLIRTLSELEPDIVHAHLITRMYQLPVALYCLWNDIALVVDDHSDDNNFSLDTLRKRAVFGTWKNTVFPVISRATDHFLPIQRYSRDFLVECLGIDDSRTTVLPLGVDTDQFYPDNNETDALRECHMESTENLLVITAGHLAPGKQIETLVRATASLADNGYGIELLVVGPGSDAYVERLKDIADASALNATFYGFASQNEIARMYNAADIGVWPGIGVSINEAIGTGLPVVIGEKRATEHLVEHGNGFTFDSDDPDELAAILRRYFEDQSLLKRQSAAAIEYTKSELSWDVVASKSIDIYRRFT